MHRYTLEVSELNEETYSAIRGMTTSLQQTLFAQKDTSDDEARRHGMKPSDWRKRCRREAYKEAAAHISAQLKMPSDAFTRKLMSLTRTKGASRKAPNGKSSAPDDRKESKQEPRFTGDDLTDFFIVGEEPVKRTAQSLHDSVVDALSLLERGRIMSLVFTSIDAAQSVNISRAAAQLGWGSIGDRYLYSTRTIGNVVWVARLE